MTALVLFFILMVEILRLLELHQIKELMGEPKKAAASPPKARESFVVKRMEEKLKQAMYPTKSE